MGSCDECVIVMHEWVMFVAKEDQPPSFLLFGHPSKFCKYFKLNIFEGISGNTLRRILQIVFFVRREIYADRDHP